MTAFDKLDDMAGRAVLRIHGEPFSVQPRSTGDDVNGRAGNDPNRPARTFPAAVHSYFSRADMQDGGSARSLTATTAANLAQGAGHTSARIRIKFKPSALPYRLARGDRVTRVGTGEVFTVAEYRISSGDNATADLNILVRPQ